MHTSVQRTRTVPRPFAFLTLSFLIGIALALYTPISSWTHLRLWGVGAAVIGLMLVICCIAQRRYPVMSHAVFALFMCIFCLLGVFRVYLFDVVQYRDLHALAGEERRYLGLLIDDPMPSNSQKTLGFSVRIFACQSDTEEIPVHGRVRLYADPKAAAELRRGDRIAFSACFSEPKDAAYAGGYSYREALCRQNLAYSCYIKTLSEAADRICPFTLTERLRGLGGFLQDSILRSVDSSFGTPTEESALLKGILMGDREDFTEEQYQHFADSGLMHITAVSGMHVMFLTSFFFFLSRKIRIPKKFANLFLIPILILFAAASAFTPSVCRSVMTMLLFLLGMLVQKEPDGLTSLAVSAFLLLCLNPYTLTGYSFILSFGSTLGILTYQPLFQGLGHRLSPHMQKGSDSLLCRIAHKGVGEAFSSVSMSLASNVGIGYFSMRFFSRLNWGALLGNIVLLPLSAASFVLGLLNWPLSFVYPSLSVMLARYVLRPILFMINRLAALCAHPVFQIHTPTPPVSFLFLYLALALLLYACLSGLFHEKSKK